MMAERRKRPSYSQQLRDHEKEGLLNFLKKERIGMKSIIYDERVKK